VWHVADSSREQRFGLIEDMRIVPLNLRKANDFVENWHRHSARTSNDGGKYAIIPLTYAAAWAQIQPHAGRAPFCSSGSPSKHCLNDLQRRVAGMRREHSIDRVEFCEGAVALASALGDALGLRVVVASGNGFDFSPKGGMDE